MLYLLLFLEGFIALSYQVLFFRQTEPHVGSSSEITGWIIGLFLLALSLGYKRGGHFTPNPIYTLGLNFMKTAVVGGLGASAILLESYFSLLSPHVGGIPSLVIFSIAVVSPVAYWMGQSIPLILQRSTWGDDISSKGGNALFLSTLGSTFGSIVTSNGLLNWIGATGTLIAISFISMFTGAALCVLYRKTLSAPDVKGNLVPFWTLIFTAALGLLVNFLFKPNVPYLSTAYADMYVAEDNQFKFLWSNNLVMSIADGRGNNAADYINETARLLAFHGIKNSNIAVLGAGGFMLHKADQGENHYTYIDIDPKLQNFVSENFNPDASEQRFIAKDARNYLLDDPRSHDVIYLDTFSSRHALPRHLLTLEFFELLFSRINEGGLLLVNAIYDPAFKDDYSRNFHTTLMKVFPFCLSETSVSGGQAANIIYHCVKRSEGTTIYTDDRNTSDRDSVKSLGR